MCLVKVLSESGPPTDSMLLDFVRRRRCQTQTQVPRNGRHWICRLLRPSSTLCWDYGTRSAGLSGHVAPMFHHAVRAMHLYAIRSGDACPNAISIFLCFIIKIDGQMRSKILRVPHFFYYDRSGNEGARIAAAKAVCGLSGTRKTDISDLLSSTKILLSH